MIKLLSFSLLFVYVTASTLYGLNDPSQLVTIDTITAQITKLGPIISEVPAQQLTVIDNQNQLYYFIGLNETASKSQLVSLALNDGHLLRSVDLPFMETVFVGVGQTLDINPTSGVLYISGISPQDQLHVIFRYDPKSGQFDKLNEIGDGNVLGAIHAFDPNNNLLWLSYAGQDDIELFALDVTTGKWVFQHVPNPLNMESMTFDKETGLMYGIGLTFQDQNHTRMLLTFNTKTLEWGVVGNIPGYFIIDADLAAMDEKNRKLFVVMQVNDEKGPFQLLTLDMNTATVEAHPDVSFPTGFPWSIDFFNK